MFLCLLLNQHINTSKSGLIMKCGVWTQHHWNMRRLNKRRRHWGIPDPSFFPFSSFNLFHDLRLITTLPLSPDWLQSLTSLSNSWGLNHELKRIRASCEKCFEFRCFLWILRSKLKVKTTPSHNPQNPELIWTDIHPLLSQILHCSQLAKG